MRVDIKNGITITRELHNEFHKKYGKFNFTKQNFMDFITEINNGRS